MDPNYQKYPFLVRNLLSTDTGILGKVMQHIYFLKGLDQQLGAFLGPLVHKHCSIANLANDTLILHVDTPSWASKIRYNTPQILSFLQSECDLASLKTIRIKVMPVSTQATLLVDKRWKLDKSTANLISRCASSITDESLKSSLLKFCKHCQNSP